MHHHIRLLHQAQRTEGEQIGIARPTTHQIHLTHRMFGFGFLREHIVQRVLRGFVLTGEHHFRDRPLEDFFPKNAPVLGAREALFYFVAELPGEAGQAAIRAGNQGF